MKKSNSVKIIKVKGLDGQEIVVGKYDEAKREFRCEQSKSIDFYTKLNAWGLDEKVANFFYTDVDQNGNVLAAKSWNIAKNDAWVLGGINANCTFNIVYDKKIENETDIDAFIDECIDSHSEEYPLTVTAREIFGLREAGYTPIIMYGALFFVPNSNVHTMSLAQYHSAINYAHFNSNDGQDKDYTKNLIKKYLLSSLNGQ